MADLRVLRWRSYLAIAAAIVVALWWVYSGGPGYVIRVDYQWLGGLADGAEVVIDGEVVGVIEYHPNRQPIIGFRVKRGEHVVELHADGCDPRPETVEVEGSRIHTIFADLDESGGGCTIFFR